MDPRYRPIEAHWQVPDHFHVIYDGDLLGVVCRHCGHEVDYGPGYASMQVWRDADTHLRARHPEVYPA